MVLRPLTSLALVLALGACASAPPPRASVLQLQESPIAAPDQPDELFVSFLFGLRNYDDEGWATVDDQTTLGLVGDWFRSGKLGAEVGIFRSFGRESSNLAGDIDGDTFEISLGTRYNFVTHSIAASPYVGLGVSYLDGRIENQDDLGFADGEDETFGAYVQAGVRWYVSNDTTVGFEYRYLTGLDFEFGPDEVSPDYHQLALFLGVKF